jgi:hypothetical protein
MELGEFLTLVPGLWMIFKVFFEQINIIFSSKQQFAGS